MNFVPEQTKAVQVPYYEDATKEDGWKGQATEKSVERLQKEISEAINRLGGIVSGFQKGIYQTDTQKREGFQIHYAIKSPDGQFIPGRLDVAALPVSNTWDARKKDKSLRMALFMVREALEGMWLMQQLSPGYAALMPWMITENGQTITQRWADSAVMNRLLPPGEAEFIEAEVTG